MAPHQDRDQKLNVGSTVSQRHLSIHLGKPSNWVRMQADKVRHRGEVWGANYYNGGRIQNYTLLSIESAAQQDDAASRTGR